MDKLAVLRAIADETRMKILTLLLEHNYCVRALAKELELSESTISQHLKVLREVGLLIGEKHGYFMHYDVERTVLHELAGEIEALAATPRGACTPETGKYKPSEQEECHAQNCSDETIEFCHGKGAENEGDAHHGNCKCHQSETKAVPVFRKNWLVHFWRRVCHDSTYRSGVRGEEKLDYA